MKYKLLRTLCVAVSMVMLVLSFAACGKDDENDAVSIGGYQANKYSMIVDSVDKINCDYLLVYNDKASYAEVDACMDLLETLSNTVNATFQICPDSLTVTDANQKMIVLGVTGYAESEKSVAVMDAIRNNNYYDYMLRSYGNILTVNWISKFGREEAFGYLVDTVFDDNAESAFDGEYSYLYLNDRSDSPVVTIDDVNIEEYSVVLPSAPSYMERMNAEKLVKAIKDATGVEVPLVTDVMEESTYEILIGDIIGRGESAVTSFFSDKRYALVQYGTKFILRGGQVEATSAAVAILTGMINHAAVTAEPVHLSYGYCKTGSIGVNSTNNFNGYSLVYSDDFESSIIDKSIWNVNDIEIPSYGIAPSIMYYRPKNVSLMNGNLILSTYLGSDGYVSGWMDTYNTVRMKYGYFEIKARFRTAPGYWVKMMLTDHYDNKDTVTQIDVFNSLAAKESVFASLGEMDQETYYQDYIKLIEPSYIEGYRSGQLAYDQQLNDAEYHTYGVEWTDDYVRFFIDGVPYGTVETTDEKYDYLNKELYLSLFVGVELTDQATDDETAQWPAPYEIDWVKVYQKPGSTITYGAVNAPETEK